MYKYYVECDYSGCGRTEETEPEASYDSALMIPKYWGRHGYLLYCPRHNNPYVAWTPPPPLSPMAKMMKELYKDTIISQLVPKNQILVISPDIGKFKPGESIKFPIDKDKP